jgi:hypothetical protein
VRNIKEIINDSYKLFNLEKKIPQITLRAGDAEDRYEDVLPLFDPKLDEPTDEYLEKYHCGLIYLDTDSWRFYLPYLIDYSLRKLEDGELIVDSFLSSLRPPDREPPRFKSLSDTQKELIKEVLYILAFDDKSIFKEYAMTVLEEYWIPNSLYEN